MEKLQRDSMVFYHSFREAAKNLTKKDQIVFYNIIFDYGFLGIEPNSEETSSIVLSLFALIKPQIDKNIQRYENGRKGGAPKGNKNAKKQPNLTENNQKQPNDNVNDNVDVNGVGSTEEQLPQLSSILSYISKHRLNVNGNVFYEHYQKQNWRTENGDVITDWEKLLRLWNATEKKTTSRQGGFNGVKRLDED